jgi:hypothetical protein
VIKHALLIAILLTTSCSDDSKRAQVAPTCTGIGCTSGIGPGGVGGGTSDASAGDSGDAATDVGDAGANVTAIVRSMARFTDDPTTGTPITMNVLVRARKVGTGTVDGTLAADGTHTLNDVAVTVGAPTNFQVLQAGVLKANDGIWLPATGTIALPLFPDSVIANAWAVTGGVGAVPPSTAHVVIHVVNAAGARISGATTMLPSDGRGPFYDDGAEISPAPKATGARGTILLMGVSGAEISVTIASAGKTLALRVPLTANAVTYMTAPIK